MNNNVKYIEGSTPFFFIHIPYFWEARGIKSGFQLTDEGYITEIAIPAEVLGWESVSLGKEMGANLRVVDMDSGMNFKEADKGFIWALDPDHSAHFCTKSYNRISYSKKVSTSVSPSQQPLLENTDGNFSVTLGMPDDTAGRSIMNAVLSDLAIPDFSAAEEKLLPLKDELWVKPLLGIIQLKLGDVRACTDMFIGFENECHSDWATIWVKNLLIDGAFDVMQYYKGKEIKLINMNKFEIMENTSRQYLDTKPQDPECNFALGHWLVCIGNYKSAIKYFEVSEKLTTNENLNIQAKLQRSLCFLYTNHHDDAKKIATELSSMSIDDETKQIVEMIILSSSN